MYMQRIMYLFKFDFFFLVFFLGFTLFVNMEYGWHVFGLKGDVDFGNNIYPHYKSPSNPCLQKCMILLMEMMTMMIHCKNSQVPTSINVIVHKWKPLHSVIQYCICNILPLLSLYDFWNVFCWTWCSLGLRSIINKIPRSPPPSPYLPPWVEKEAMQSIEPDLQMTPINTISFRKERDFCMLLRFFKT
jgi:hypothetical protein